MLRGFFQNEYFCGMSEFLRSYIADLHRIFRAHHVIKAEVNGSVLTSDFNDSSDVDLLVSFSDRVDVLDYSDNYFSLKEALEALLNRRVDLISERSLKNPVLIESINQSKQSLYAA